MGIVWGAWAGRYELSGLNMEESNNNNNGASSAKSTKIRCDPRFSRGGSRRDGDVAMAIFASYVIGQFMPLFY
jgi:hypothetical protein